MTKLRLFGAVAAILSSALASPVTGQEVIYNPGYCAQFYPNANCQNLGPGNPYTGNYRQQTYGDQVYGGQVYRDQAYQDRAWRGSYNRWDGNSGFWPGNVAAGTAAAAIAYPPIGSEDYARRNGFVCTPGTWFRGEDGRRHICQ